jgi:predicted membrane channel-forming protein YqfA (hemolysin III family)
MTFVFQKRGPWDLTNTIMPIVIFILIAIANCVRNGLPKFNFDAMSYGGFYLVGAIAMFIKGLDDLNDYLRMYHSLWHVLIGLSTYYLWQLQDAVLLPMRRILKEEYTSIIINKQFDLI